MAKPSIHLRLIPEVDGSGKISRLGLRLTLKSLSLEPGDILCTLGRPGVPRQETSWNPYYVPHDISTLFSDGDGPLDIYTSEGSNNEFRVRRQTQDDIIVTWEVSASERSDIGSVYPLLRDEGGLMGVGKYFIPRFDLGDESLIAIEWDLSSCPQGTRAVTSFGEGPQRIELMGNIGTLLDCVFMTGPVRSHTQDPPSPSSKGEGSCGTYWFGDLPSNLDAVSGYATKMFPRMAEHFGDRSGSYRAFLRRTSKGLRATAFQSSSIVEYDGEAEDEDDWDLVRLLNRVMVSTWARLDFEDDGTANEWFTDGLSLLYTVFLPFRFGQRGPDYFRATVNAFLSAYYTNPLVSTPSIDPQIVGTTGLSWYASSAKASRAFVYMLKMDAFTRRAAVARGSDLLRPMDELMRDLLSRRRNGEMIQKEHWLEGVAYWLGEEKAERCFREMLDTGGKVNELDDMLSSFVRGSIWPTAC
ncbi:hypothetical protein diail_10756 [Diaporthe ilicicola]|nr:hypothetical protein diail_10756 [Diaporthe ilicicola]